MLQFIDPMDCAPLPRLPDGSQWFFEIKVDGYRAVAVKADGRVNLFSRPRKSFDHHYPLIVEAIGELPEGAVVDGDVVALDESGRPNFNLLQDFRSEAFRVHYFIFDPLIYRDRGLTRLPLSERRKLMKSLLKLRSDRLHIVSSSRPPRPDMLAAVGQKRRDSGPSSRLVWNHSSKELKL
jgi:ATP-dependent DNA ligase